MKYWKPDIVIPKVDRAFNFDKVKKGDKVWVECYDLLDKTHRWGHRWGVVKEVRKDKSSPCLIVEVGDSRCYAYDKDGIFVATSQEVGKRVSRLFMRE